MVTVEITVYAGENNSKLNATLTVATVVSGGNDVAHDRRVASQVGARLLTALGSIEEVGAGAIRSTYVIPVTMPDAVDARASRRPAPTKVAEPIEAKEPPDPSVEP